jgi:hypothetical protein
MTDNSEGKDIMLFSRRHWTTCLNYYIAPLKNRLFRICYLAKRNSTVFVSSSIKIKISPYPNPCWLLFRNPQVSKPGKVFSKDNIWVCNKCVHTLNTYFQGTLDTRTFVCDMSLWMIPNECIQFKAKIKSLKARSECSLGYNNGSLITNDNEPQSVHRCCYLSERGFENRKWLRSVLAINLSNVIEHNSKTR